MPSESKSISAKKPSLPLVDDSNCDDSACCSVENNLGETILDGGRDLKGLFEKVGLTKAAAVAVLAGRKDSMSSREQKRSNEGHLRAYD